MAPRIIGQLAVAALTLGVALPCVAQGNGGPSYPGDDESFKGDRLTFRTLAQGIKRSDQPADEATTYCAGPSTAVRVRDETTHDITFRVTEMPKSPPSCASGAVAVQEGIQYAISKTALAKYDYYRTGISFGGLVVPFKVRLGKDKDLIASPAIAPFVGYRTSWMQGVGVTFTPVLAAGLSLVPVPDASGETTETKAAYTTAIGFRVTSSKNGGFSAGLLYGRDFLGKRIADTDPRLHKPWFSFYVGASL
jgi:hypothetical protein